MTAGICLYFLYGIKFKFKLGNKRVNSIKELKVIYGNTKELEQVVLKFQETEYFIQNNKSSMIILEEDENLALAKFNEAIEIAKEITSKYMREQITTPEELNVQLEEVLQY